MNDSSTVNALPRVHIVYTRDTAAAATDIIRGLDQLGVDGSAPVPTTTDEVRAVVVLLSAHALHDPEWVSRVESLRAERLVPVSVGDLVDSDVPQFLRELNWVFYRPDDVDFLAKLFTGINTDASRFRDNRDTRALAERWEGSDRNPDLLLDSLREVQRRIRIAAVDAESSDPLIPREQIVQLVGSLRDRFRFLYGPISETTSEGKLPQWIAWPITLWLAMFPGVVDRLFIENATTPVAFLAASRRHAVQLLRRRMRRVSIRSVLAALTVLVVVATVIVVQQAVKKSNNALAFSIGDIAINGRSDISAIKAAASLVDSEIYSGNDGRFRIVTNALSQHWTNGYLAADGAALVSAVFLADGSIRGVDFDGRIWTWNATLDSRSWIETGASGTFYFDASPDGRLAVVGDETVITVVKDSSIIGTIEGLGVISGFRLAPANDRLLVFAGDSLWSIDNIGSASQRPRNLGNWASVIDMTQTSNGGVAALVAQDGLIEIVSDDGTVVDVGRVPLSLKGGALARDGRSFALNVSGTIWTSTTGPITSSGIPIPGVQIAMAMTSDGLVLVADRTAGSWVADPKLGIRLGTICDGMPGTASFVVDSGGRILCITANVTVDSLADLRPAGISTPIPAPTLTVTSRGKVSSLSLVDGLIVLERNDGHVFSFDAAGLSFAPNFTQPAEIAHADFFATGALIEARSLPTTVAVNADGNTFAVGFVDGRLIEVDINSLGHLAPVGSWQLPDHEAVRAIEWSNSDTLIATTARGTQWERASCAGCWSNGTFVDRIAERAWFCYPAEDIEALGDTPRRAFHLRDCESHWGDAG